MVALRDRVFAFCRSQLPPGKTLTLAAGSKRFVWLDRIVAIGSGPDEPCWVVSEPNGHEWLVRSVEIAGPSAVGGLSGTITTTAELRLIF